MQGMATAQRMTAQEYLAIPYDGIHSELVEGEVIVHHPDVTHQVVLANLNRVLDAWARETAGRGAVRWPLDVQIDENSVLGPDLLWYSQGRAPMPGEQRPYPLPDLVVEVRSPTTWRYDVGAKKAAYERNGLPELWLVDTPARELLVFRRSAPHAPRFDVTLEIAADDTLSSPLLPGFALVLGTLFEA
jgi:Uma2 family endonuclease